MNEDKNANILRYSRVLPLAFGGLSRSALPSGLAILGLQLERELESRWESLQKDYGNRMFSLNMTYISSGISWR